MTTWAEVDLSAIRSNVQAIKTHIQREGRTCPALIAVIKADAYGHGVIPVARVLREEVAMYAVATVEEGIELRAAGIKKPILVLFNALPDQAEPIVCCQLTQSVCEPTLCQALSRIAQVLDRRVKVHVDVDTGMNRGGVEYTEAVDFIQWMTSLAGIEVEGIFTHFATADEADQRDAHLQLERFESVLSALSHLNRRPPIAHAANSAAALTLPNTYFDAVRLGLSLYGINPSPQIAGRHVVNLRPALNWKARIICLHDAAAGEGVSYGGTYRTDVPTRLATLPVGYADGYPRALSNLGEALIGGVRHPLVGRVCMDGTVFRIDPSANVAVGDEAVLIGTQGDEAITVDQVAGKAGTISYEILTGIGKRVRRVYVNQK
ncbi:MAG: alanine racemase [Candidatus Poribacteria bacterium]|nr:alanine racemase [Candidatus Poribacteria bacterium]